MARLGDRTERRWLVKKMKRSVFVITQTYKSIGDKMQGNQGGKMWEKKMKKFSTLSKHRSGRSRSE